MHVKKYKTGNFHISGSEKTQAENKDTYVGEMCVGDVEMRV